MTTELLTLHGGPADGTRYTSPGHDQLPAKIQVSLRLRIPDELIDSAPLLPLQGEGRAIYRYLHRPGTTDYYWRDTDLGGDQAVN